MRSPILLTGPKVCVVSQPAAIAAKQFCFEALSTNSVKEKEILGVFQQLN